MSAERMEGAAERAAARRSFLLTPEVLIAGVLLLAIGLYPLIAPTPYLIGLGIVAGAMAVGTVGFVLPIGYAHQLVLGQAAFCMIGGYSTGILVVRHGWDPGLAMVFGALLSAAIAWCVGGPVLRLRGFMLAMASLAIHLILIFAVRELEFTGQALGVSGVPRFTLGGLNLSDDYSFYYVVWALAFACALVGVNIKRSKSGRALQALGASETAAASMGVNVARAKLEMFTISAAMASLSGSLTVHYLRVMEPTVFDFHFSLNIVTAVVVGGILSVWGGITGAAVFIAVREGVRELGFPYLDSLIMALASCIMLIALPSGIVGAAEGLLRRVMGGRAPGIARTAGGALENLPRHAVAKADTLLDVAGVSRSFGALRAVQDVSFTLQRGGILGIIGPNGAGKTTLFNMICGFEQVDGGQVTLSGRRIERLPAHRIAGLGLARTFQVPQVGSGITTLDSVMGGAHRHLGYGVIAASLRLPNVTRAEAALRDRAAALLADLGLAPHNDVDSLSFGQRRLLEFARALLLEPELLLMDEPASGLNDSETEMLGRMIVDANRRGITILLIEHDLRLVFGISDRIVVLHHGEKIAEGTPAEVRADPTVIEAYIGRAQ